MLEFLISVLVNIHTLEPTKQGSSQEPTTQIIKLDSSRPLLQAEAGIVADLNSGQILYQKNGLEKYPIASLTKLMTALIIIQEHKLNEVVTVPQLATQVGGSSINLQSKEKITVLNLLKGLLIQSGNDAAVALAVHNSQSVDKFVKKMNLKANELNLQNTNFANPMGFDDPENYSTAQDLFTLAKAVYQYPTIQKIVNTKETTIYSTDKASSHLLQTTNLILDNYLNVGGLKTGTTSQAGGCFIGITKNEEHPKIAIVLGSNDRFLDTKVMLDWVQNTFKYNNL
jgi:D-alanyl-D-alanine carboxypeptidase (penicillin-binding protein 5/6)